MRVLHVSPTSYGAGGITGGGERYAFDLARAMSRHVDTTMFCFGRTADVRQDGALRIETWPTTTWIDGNPVNPRAWRFLRRLPQYDVIHCHQYETWLTTMTAVAGRLLGRRVFASDYGGGGRHPGRILRSADLLTGFLCISKFSAEFFARRAAKTHVIYGGVDSEFFHPSDGAGRRREVLFTGRLIPAKGVDVLLRAVRGRAPVRIIGTPYHAEYAAECRRLAAEYGQVTFHEGLDDDALRRHYQEVAVSVLPSLNVDRYGRHHRKPELLGLVLLEAMACETPVVASSVGSLPELVRPDVNGALAPPGDPDALWDAIDAILRDAPRARRLGQAGRALVRAEFTWDRVVQRCLEAYGTA